MRGGHEVAHEFQQQPLLLRRPERVVPAYPIEKVADVNAEHLRRFVEPASGHAVDALLILVGLLESDPMSSANWCWLRPSMIPPFSDALADMPVDILRTTASASIRTRLLAHYGASRGIRTRVDQHSREISPKLRLPKNADG
jgi:hypothetical protein